MEDQSVIKRKFYQIRPIRVSHLGIFGEKIGGEKRRGEEEEEEEKRRKKEGEKKGKGMETICVWMVMILV